MTHFLIIIAYDGSRYAGWQRLSSNANTIQNIIENALTTLCKEPITINGSGRTDAGVSAMAQVADFHCKRNPCSDNTTFIQAINELLPADIAVTHIKEIPATCQFHSRKSAVEKHYRYSIGLTSKTSPFTGKHVYQPTDAPICFPYGQELSLDEAAMRQCALALCNTHDFSAFTSDKRPDKNHIRTIHHIDLSIKQDDFENAFPVLQLDFYGDGFLYNMVRILAGTILYCGMHRIKAAQIPDIFEAKLRKNAGPTLPSNGLMLMSVTYEESLTFLFDDHFIF